jgi:hypothetical protein
MKRFGYRVSRIGAIVLTVSILAACGPPPPPGAVYVRVAPPAPVYEEVVTAPSPDYVWVRGHHAWEEGRYVWVRGHWARRPHARARWVEGHWRHTRHGWYWVEGHWR